MSLCLLPSAGHAEQAGLKVCRLGSLGEWSDPGSVRALSQESGEGRAATAALPTYSIHARARICAVFNQTSEFVLFSHKHANMQRTAYAHITENAKGFLRHF